MDAILYKQFMALERDSMDAMLELKGVSKRFGPVTAVHDVSFKIGRGQVASILGPSGCGKTTLLRLVAGFEQPDPAGDILIAGANMRGRRPYERNIGLVFQDYALFPHLSVEQNIAFGPRERGVPGKEIARRTREVLEIVKLSGYERRNPQQLSGGEQQRVAIARALITRPSIMLLDEPLSNLDAKLREMLRSELRSILTAAGITTIIVTHDQEEAMAIADHIIVMERGQVVQQGSAEEIYNRPSSRFVADFIGRSNWLAGRISRRLAPALLEFVTSDGLLLRTIETLPDSNAGFFQLGIRPELIEVDRCIEPMGAVPDDGNILTGTIEETTFLGPNIHLWIAVSPTQRIHVVEQNRGKRVMPPGTTVTLRFRPENCILLECPGHT